MSFRYTPDTLNLIRAWVRGGRGETFIARQLACTVPRLREICAKHEISLVTGGDTAVVDESADRFRTPAPLAPRLDPSRRKARADLKAVHFDIAVAAIRSLESEAVRRGTTAAVLAAACLELITEDDLFAAVLDT